jgi:hypothetical protein
MRSPSTASRSSVRSPASPQFQNPTIYNPKANFTYVRGQHSMKIGY